MVCLIIFMGACEGVWILEEGKGYKVTQDQQANECAVEKTRQNSRQCGLLVRLCGISPLV